MKTNKKYEVNRYLARPAEKKPLPILDYIQKVNSLYSGNGEDPEKDPKYIDPLEMQKIKEAIPVSPMVKKKKPNKWKYTSRFDEMKNENLEVAGIKDTSLYKLLENPKVLGMELGHDTIMQVIEILKNSGVVKKPKKEIKKIAVAAKPEDPIDHIALLEKNFS